MKQTNFFISLLICLGLMFAVSSCNDKERPLVCGENVIICADLFQNTPDVSEQTMFGISNVRIEGNNLKFTINSGGCGGSTWVVKLVVAESVSGIYPPARTLRILFENNEDCFAIVNRDFSFSIECLKPSWISIAGYSFLFE